MRFNDISGSGSETSLNGDQVMIGIDFSYMRKNSDLIKYLLSQLQLDHFDRINALKEFFPQANSDDWTLSIAGQRVQMVKMTKDGGKLKLGTEVVTSSDGSLAALLGASPGASTAVTIML